MDVLSHVLLALNRVDELGGDGVEPLRWAPDLIDVLEGDGLVDKAIGASVDDAEAAGTETDVGADVFRL